MIPSRVCIILLQPGLVRGAYCSFDDTQHCRKMWFFINSSGESTVCSPSFREICFNFLVGDGLSKSRLAGWRVDLEEITNDWVYKTFVPERFKRKRDSSPSRLTTSSITDTSGIVLKWPTATTTEIFLIMRWVDFNQEDMNRIITETTSTLILDIYQYLLLTAMTNTVLQGHLQDVQMILSIFKTLALILIARYLSQYRRGVGENHLFN